MKMKLGYIAKYDLKLNPHLTEPFVFKEASCGEKSTEGLDAVKWDYWLPDYCPHCGAIMDGGADHEAD